MINNLDIILKKLISYKVISGNIDYYLFRSFTHSEPIFIFWITLEGNIIKVNKAHHAEPPHGDMSILVAKDFNGYIRGRIANYNDVTILVVYNKYNNRTKTIIKNTLKELRISVPEIQNKVYIVSENMIRKELKVVDEYRFE